MSGAPVGNFLENSLKIERGGSGVKHSDLNPINFSISYSFYPFWFLVL